MGGFKSKVEFKNKFSWSVSRDRLFRDCPRAYYFYYYASWGGWDRDSQSLARKAYILKNMKNVDIWVGQVSHQVIQEILQARLVDKKTSKEEAIIRSHNLFNQGWQQSLNKAWQNNIKYNLNLFEHYYNSAPDLDKVKQSALDKLTKVIDNFYQRGFSDYLDNLVVNKYLAIEELGNFLIDDITIYAVPDFAFKKDDNFYLYDWKTGKIDEANINIQLGCYSLYAIDKWQAVIENIQVIPVYLSLAEVKLTPVKVPDINSTKEYIKKSIDLMQGCLENKQENIINKDLCAKTTDAWRCKYCNFKEICD